MQHLSGNLQSTFIICGSDLLPAVIQLDNNSELIVRVGDEKGGELNNGCGCVQVGGDANLRFAGGDIVDMFSNFFVISELASLILLGDFVGGRLELLFGEVGGKDRNLLSLDFRLLTDFW